MERSFDKGDTWERLNVQKHTVQGEDDRFKVFAIPPAISWTDRVYVGRYWDNNSHDVKGLIGYIKYGVGSHLPTYKGVKFQTVPRAYKIKDGKLFGYEFDNKNTAGNNIGSLYNMYGSAAIYNLGKNSSKVLSNEQVFKFRGSIAEGTKMGLKITLESAANTVDSTQIQGLMFNYVRNNL